MARGIRDLPIRSKARLAVSPGKWHKADMFNALTSSAFGGKADSDQPLLTNLDL